MKRLLYITPVSSHDHPEGNAERIKLFLHWMKKMSVSIHVILFDLYGTSVAQYKKMFEEWGEVTYIKPEKTDLKPGQLFSTFESRGLSTLREAVLEFSKYSSYDMTIVNYTWIADAIVGIDGIGKKVVDTHDIFSNRHLVSIDNRLGVQDAWYFLAPENEIRILSDFDYVIAIQDSESSFYRKIVGVDAVKVIGHPIEPNFPPLPDLSNRKIRVGYIGSNNIWNQKCIREFSDELSKVSSHLSNYEFILAGGICNYKFNDRLWVKLGFVKSIEDFYDQIDVCLNPMRGGTGLKIKSVEAMAFGKILLSTCDGSAGLPKTKLNVFSSLSPMVKSLVDLNDDRRQLELLRGEQDRLYSDYYKQQLNSIKELLNAC